MRLTEVLDLLAYPTGTILRINFRKFELGDPDTLAVTSPQKFLSKLSLLYGGDEKTAEALIFLTACTLVEMGMNANPYEFLRAFKEGNVEMITSWLKSVEELIKDRESRRPGRTLTDP